MNVVSGRVTGPSSMIFRVDPDTSSIPTKFAEIHNLTLYIRGPVADGAILGEILFRSPMLKTVRIERRDNDWDAPDTAFRLTNEAQMVNYVKDHPALKEFSMTGITTSVEELCKGLSKLEHLEDLSIKADPHFAKYYEAGSETALLSPATLVLLLQSCKHRLALAGLFPETIEYTKVLHDVFVRDCSKLHIFVHFGGRITNSSGYVTKVSPFSYFLRDVMELNQKGRRGGDIGKLVQQYARKRNGSLDVLFILLRENPWLCESLARQPMQRPSMKQRMQRLISRFTCRGI